MVNAPARRAALQSRSACAGRAARSRCPTNLASRMARGSAVRNRSESVTVATPRRSLELVRQERRDRRGSGWTWFWLARRAGHVDWHQANTPAEAIRRAILLPARTPPAWLREAAVAAQH